MNNFSPENQAVGRRPESHLTKRQPADTGAHGETESHKMSVEVKNSARGAYIARFGFKEPADISFSDGHKGPVPKGDKLEILAFVSEAQNWRVPSCVGRATDGTLWGVFGDSPGGLVTAEQLKMIQRFKTCGEEYSGTVPMTREAVLDWLHIVSLFGEIIFEPNVARLCEVLIESAEAAEKKEHSEPAK